MHLTTKGKYAVVALLDLALNESRFCFVSLSEVAKRQSIPAPYLEQLFRNLRKAKILEAVRGPKGGFRLSRSSKDINIEEIVSAVEKRMDATQCRGEVNCSSGKVCLAHDLWTDLNNQVKNFLSSKSLNDILVAQIDTNNDSLTQEVLIASG